MLQEVTVVYNIKAVSPECLYGLNKTMRNLSHGRWSLAKIWARSIPHMKKCYHSSHGMDQAF